MQARGLRAEPRRARGWCAAPRDRAEAEDGRRRFVAGALGPTNRTASISPDVNNPGYRAVSFDDLRVAYAEQVARAGRRRRRPDPDRDDLRHAERQGGDLRLRGGLRREGRAAAADDLGHDHRPLGAHALGPDADRLLALGPPRAAVHRRAQLRARRGGDAAAPRRALRRSPTRFTCAYPNAGLPNAFGGYDESPEFMAAQIEEFAREGLVNVVGGCCGTTPEHIRAIAEAVAKYPPRHDPRARAADAALRARAVHADPGDPLRQRRRAHQRHRLGALPQARSPPATTPPRSRSRATRSRTARRSSTSTWTRA